VFQGSEQVMLIVRDKDTGLTLSRSAQIQNADYDIKYVEGRIVFNRPISSIVNDNSLVNESILGGHPVFVQVDYEAEVDSFEQSAAGASVQQHIYDKVAVGSTDNIDEISAGR